MSFITRGVAEFYIIVGVRIYLSVLAVLREDRVNVGEISNKNVVKEKICHQTLHFCSTSV